MIELRGYAAPFDEPGKVGRWTEYYSAGAFRSFLEKGGAAYINAHDHSSRPLSAAVTLHMDDWGLGFRALVLDGIADIAADLSRGIRWHMSVLMDAVHFEYDRRLRVRYVANADVRHLTICKTPAYLATAVWMPSTIRNSYIARLNSCWEVGSKNWFRARQSRGAVS